MHCRKFLESLIGQYCWWLSQVWGLHQSVHCIRLLPRCSQLGSYKTTALSRLLICSTLCRTQKGSRTITNCKDQEQYPIVIKKFSKSINMGTTWGYLINDNVEERILELQQSNVIVTNKGRRLFQIQNNNNVKELTVLSHPCLLNGSQVHQKINFENGARITTKLLMEEINYIFVEENPHVNGLLKQINLDEEYVIGTKIGEGGFGSVYTLFEKASGFKSALKVQRFNPDDKYPRREAEVLLQLNHSFIIRTQEIKFINKLMYIKMEFMQGGDLNKFVNISGPYLSKWQTKVIFYQIVEAVNYLHTQGICHRDLKPGNILLKNASPNTLIKVTDFGLAKSEIIHSPLNSCCGTKHFIAPEVCNMQGMDYDKIIYVWSMGVILHLSLFGKFPEFKKDTSILLWPANEFGMKNNDTFTLLQGMLQKNPMNRLEVSDVRKQKWLEDKHLEVTVRDLMVCNSNARVTPPWRMLSPGTQLLEVNNPAEDLAVTLGATAIVGAGALLFYELFKPNRNN